MPCIKILRWLHSTLLGPDLPTKSFQIVWLESPIFWRNQISQPLWDWEWKCVAKVIKMKSSFSKYEWQITKYYYLNIKCSVKLQICLKSAGLYCMRLLQGRIFRKIWLPIFTQKQSFYGKPGKTVICLDWKFAKNP